MRASYWPAPLYLDVNKVFYKALGTDGKLVKGGVLPLLNPFSGAWKQVREARRRVKDQTFVGDGRTLGGHFAIAQSGEVVFKQLEKPYGLYPSVMEVRRCQPRQCVAWVFCCQQVAAFIKQRDWPQRHKPSAVHLRHACHTQQRSTLYLRIV